MHQAETSLNRILELINEVDKYKQISRGQIMKDSIEERLNEELRSYEHDLSLGVQFLNNRPDKLRLLRSLNRGLKNDK